MGSIDVADFSLQVEFASNYAMSFALYDFLKVQAKQSSLAPSSAALKRLSANGIHNFLSLQFCAVFRNCSATSKCCR
ncbi:MAG TPA: hypothetical protein VGI40_10325, partial [Pirellulaceae bacterium]